MLKILHDINVISFLWLHSRVWYHPANLLRNFVIQFSVLHISLLSYRPTSSRRFSPDLISSIHSKSADVPDRTDQPPAVPVHRSPITRRKAVDNDDVPPTVPPKKKQSEIVEYCEVTVSCVLSCSSGINKYYLTWSI